MSDDEGPGGRSAVTLLVAGHEPVIASRADDWWGRARGLLFRKPLARGQGLLISPCSSVHTCLMRQTIDVVYLSEDLRVLKTASRVRPWRFSLCRRGARHTLELAAGEIERLELEPGARLSVHGAPELAR